MPRYCSTFFVYQSDNDPFVCLENGKKLAEKLGVDLTFVKCAGHFNEKAGYRTFSLLFDDIAKVVSN